MAQQTAVEWLLIWFDNNNYYISSEIAQAFNQAKAMERQQLANSWDKACDQYIYRDGNLVKVWQDFDKYYNQTYEKNSTHN